MSGESLLSQRVLTRSACTPGCSSSIQKLTKRFPLAPHASFCPAPPAPTGLVDGFWQGWECAGLTKNRILELGLAPSCCKGFDIPEMCKGSRGSPWAPSPWCCGVPRARMRGFEVGFFFKFLFPGGVFPWVALKNSARGSREGLFQLTLNTRRWQRLYNTFTATRS